MENSSDKYPDSRLKTMNSSTSKNNDRSSIEAEIFLRKS